VLPRRPLHEKVGYFDEELPVVGDWEFNMRAAMAGEVQLLDEPLAYWCKRPDATGSAANSVSHEQQHRIFDAQVRANAIREDLAAGAANRGAAGGCVLGGLRGGWGGRGPPPPMRPRPNSPAKLSGFPCRDEPVDLLEDSSGVESGDSSSGLVLTILLPV